MAIVKIQHRRGNYADYDPSKVLPGELVVTQADDPNSNDGEAVYIATTAGNVKRLAVAEELDSAIETALQDAIPEVVSEATQEAEAAADRAEAAAQTLEIDTTLTRTNQAAEAKAVGDELTNLKSDLDKVFSDNAKTALLNCFQHVAWVDAQGQTYYDALEAALYADSYPRITAVFDAGANVIYTDDALDTLKQYLTVKYFATKDSTGTIIASNDYTLSGVLTEGTSTITVAYNEVRTSVSIPGVVDFYNIWEWDSRFTGIGKLTRLLTNTSEKTVDRVKRGIEYASHGLPNNNRRSFYVNKGKQVFIDRNGIATSFYPVPVPKTATKLTATVTPSTQQLAAYVYKYEGNVNSSGYNYLYYAPSAVSWKTGTDTYQFEASDNLFVGFNMRVDASSTRYTDETEPELNLLFE